MVLFIQGLIDQSEQVVKSVKEKNDAGRTQM